MDTVEVESTTKIERENRRGNGEGVRGEGNLHGEGTSQPSVARARSMSVATARPSVETVVGKAKRAAQSLWILLHAQSCCTAGKCPYPGCQEAKKLHLHLKTCPATSVGEGTCCPSGHNGCQQSRKLLAHYRRCKSIRARQAGQLAGRRDSTGHHCLVCSLVARQARTILTTPSSSSLKNKCSSSRSSRGTSSFALKSSNSVMAPPPPRRRFLSPPKLADAGNISSKPLGRNTTLVSSLTADIKNWKEHTSSRSPKSISFATLPASICGTGEEPMDQEQPHDAPAGRPRSASDVAAYAHPNTGEAHRRVRSASVGEPVCETIEEEVLSDSSAGEQIEFNIDLAR